MAKVKIKITRSIKSQLGGIRPAVSKYAAKLRERYGDDRPADERQPARVEGGRRG